MSTHLVSDLDAPARRSRRALAVSAIGPLTVAAGVLWAIAQPERITVLHPAGQGFWELAVQPPLLVVLVGALFHVLLAPGLVEDLAEADAP